MFPRDPHEPRLIAWVRNPRVRRTLTLWFLWGFAALALYWFSIVLLPFGLAVLFAFIIEPVVTLVSRRELWGGRRAPRIAVVLGIYVLAFGLIYLFGLWTLPQIGREIAKLGAESRQMLGDLERHGLALLERATQFSEDNHLPFDRAEIQAFAREYFQSLQDAARANLSRVLSFGRDVVASLVHGVFGLFLVLMLTAFLSMDRERIESYALSLVPPESREDYTRLLGGIGRGLAGVVRGQLLICLTNGVLTFVGLALLGVKFKIILATMAAVFSLIPIFGSIISTVPIVAVALTDSVPKAFFVLLWIIGIHLLEANLLNPKIMGDAAKIHPVLVVFALLAGEHTAGLIGALFAVPIASVVATLFRFLHTRAVEAANAASRPGSAAWASTTGGARGTWDPGPGGTADLSPKPEGPPSAPPGPTSGES